MAVCDATLALAVTGAMGTDRHCSDGERCQPWRVCHDRPVGVVDVDSTVGDRALRDRRSRSSRPSLFWRLFSAYAAVLGLAVAVLVLAPVRVSARTAPTEVAVLFAGFTIALLAGFVLLRHALAPLERLTGLMRRIDPLAPGQRIEGEARDEEVFALTQAFNEMLDRLESERRESALRALAAQEAERRRIARELHDEIGQTLTGLVLRSETIARRGPDELRGDLEGLRESARRGAEDVRRIARRLRPEALDELGLQSALVALSGSLSQQTGVRIEHSLERDLGLTAEEELVIYRVAQESLTNVVRHAHARHATLTLVCRERDVVLEIRDDGIGLPATAEEDATGIRGMRERALLIGATLAIRATDPHGTRVRLWVPRSSPR
jgi:two-component system, NarL family, sensor histidine kinase UhpB